MPRFRYLGNKVAENIANKTWLPRESHDVLDDYVEQLRQNQDTWQEIPSNDGRGMMAVDIAILGDSISKQTGDVSAGYGGVTGDYSLSSFGYPTWWQAYSGANMNFTIYATSGAKTYTVFNEQLPSALKARHQIYALGPIGVNDDISAAESIAYVQRIAAGVMSVDGILVLGTPTPTTSYASSKTRMAAIGKAMRTLSLRNPTRIRLVDFASLLADPSSADGASYQDAGFFDAMTYDVDTDGTHDNWIAAAAKGYAVHKVTRDLTAPYVWPLTRGDADNLLPNGTFGGSSDVATSGGTNSVAPDGWPGVRGNAGVTYSMFKAKRQPLIWKTAVTYPLFSRVVPTVPNGYHYIVLTSAASGTTPSSTTAFAQTQPGASGPFYLTIPADIEDENPITGEDLLILASSATVAANMHAGISNAAIDATGMTGKTVKAGLWYRSIGSMAPLVVLRVEQWSSAPARIIGAWCNSPNSVPGSPKALYSTYGRGKRLLAATPAFTIDPACTQLRVYIRAYTPGGDYPTAVLIGDGFLAETETAPGSV